MIQLSSKDLKELREKWWKDQDGICPILGKYYDLDKFCIDHQHKLKAELPDETGKGCVRGAINFQANAWEGKVTNSFKRMGLEKHTDIISALRNLADYLEENRQHTEDELLIHPSEKPKAPVLMKSSWNKLFKAIDGKQKCPHYSRGRMTKALEKLFEKYGVTPEYKK